MIPITIVNIRLVRKELMIYHQDSTDDRRVRYTGNLLTSSEALKEVRLYGLGTYLIDKWATTFSKLKNSRSRIEIKQRAWKSLTDMLSLLVSGGLLVAIMASQNNITPGGFLVTLTALIAIQLGFFSISSSISVLIQNLEKLDDIDTYLKDARVNLVVPQNHTKIVIGDTSSKTVELVVEDLSFAYESSFSVLDHINFVVQPGKHVALVGENGAGKSTLIHLLMGLLKPNSGRILVNGIQVSDLDPQSRHHLITGVFQSFGKFHGLTVRENITLSAYEKPEMSNESVFVEHLSAIPGLKEKLDVIVGREFDGIELSGGEWQRVALARAMIHDSPLVILDEPTASLDPLVEAGLFKSYMDMLQGRTVIIATHRLGSIRFVDEIIVLANGSIVERGPHQYLIQRRGLYCQMYESQAAWYKAS